MKNAELITFLQNDLRPRTRPPPPPQMSNWKPRPSVRFRLDRPRQNVMPGSRDMDIFEQQEMRKNRSKVKSKLNDWNDWLVNHVPKPIKDKASRVFKTFKDKVMGLYNMPGSRDMDIFEQQEMLKNRSQVTSKLNDWND